MPKKIYIHIHVRDAKWEEEKHPRAPDGRFGSGSGGGSSTTGKVSLKGNELGEYADMRDLRQKALIYASRFVGKKFVNKSTGHEIQVTKTGIKHTISGSGDNLIRSIPAIPELLEKATLTSRVRDKGGDPNILAVETYMAPLGLDGKTYRAILTVKQYQDGRRFYDQGLVE